MRVGGRFFDIILRSPVIAESGCCASLSLLLPEVKEASFKAVQASSGRYPGRSGFLLAAAVPASGGKAKTSPPFALATAEKAPATPLRSWFRKTLADSATLTEPCASASATYLSSRTASMETA